MCHLVLPCQFTVFSKFIIKVPSNNGQPSELQDCHYFHLRQEAFVLKYLLPSSDGLYSIADQDFSISDKTYEEIHVNTPGRHQFLSPDTAVGQNYTLKQRKAGKVLLHNRPDLWHPHFNVNFVDSSSQKRCLRRKFLPRKILYYSNVVAAPVFYS